MVDQYNVRMDVCKNKTQSFKKLTDVDSCVGLFSSIYMTHMIQTSLGPWNSLSVTWVCIRLGQSFHYNEL